MERKEPTIESDDFELTNRVKLTWREVRQMALDDVQTVQKKTGAELQDQYLPALTEEQKAELVSLIAPAVEAEVRHALRGTLEISMQNALTRVKADLDRSVSGIVAEAVRSKLSKADLSDLSRR